MIKTILIKLIHVYRYLFSPFLGNRCRFHPSCSEYMIEAIQQHGIIRGMGLGFKRLGRCHPWSEGGLDPVPEAKTKNHKTQQ
ncbi:membrane protein insertion efficiency factor YidD [Marinicella sp. W31]|uniref:membrane protein insertion efficiency factor YidD n=1 Tax=Marinicella sp. W31 TaxID=3023713 RepID=UPI0037573B68